tara:strand:+ start:6860 stop:7048 length:189 start_codon:yes stop_codon:yes gene_type:complete
MDKFEKARKFFHDLEKGKKGKSVAAVISRVKKLGTNINQEALRRFKVQQRLDEVKKAIEIEV